MFKDFQKAFQKSFNDLLKTAPVAYVVDVSGHDLVDTYLGAFPEDVRQGYNCNCCKSFIKHYGGIVVLKDGKVRSFWDFQAEGYYGPVVEAMNRVVTAAKVRDVFVQSERQLGTAQSLQTKLGEPSITWDHIYAFLPAQLVRHAGGVSNATVRSEHAATKHVLKRGLEEIPVSATESVLELIATNKIHRGNENKPVIQQFLKLQEAYAEQPNENAKDRFAWEKALAVPHVARIRNTAIGTLLVDVAEGVDLNVAEEKFGRMMDPYNYKRPKAPIENPKRLEEARKTLQELGLESALLRRFAKLDDLPINDVLYIDLKQAPENVFDELKADLTVNPKTLENSDSVTLEKFLAEVIPTAKTLEILLENRFEPQFVSLIAPADPDAGSLFKWGNRFSWSYNEALAASAMKDRVKAAGGKVDGVLGFRLQWNEDGRNNVDLDAHAYEPDGTEIAFNSHRAPGRTSMSGQLDVDIVAPNGKIAVENITWSTRDRMKFGKYKFFVHNFSGQQSTGGFSAEVEFEGQVYTFEYGKPIPGKGRVDVATVTYTKAGFEVVSHIPSNTALNTKNYWGLDTNKFHKVRSVMLSPNHWEGEKAGGNKHTFFMLEGAKNDGKVRGFFNEFLSADLHQKHRHVFELLGGKVKVKPTDNELSGIGIDSDNTGHFYARVTGRLQRTIKVTY